jgi:hypothetical protein
MAQIDTKEEVKPKKQVTLMELGKRTKQDQAKSCAEVSSPQKESPLAQTNTNGEPEKQASAVKKLAPKHKNGQVNIMSFCVGRDGKKIEVKEKLSKHPRSLWKDNDLQPKEFEDLKDNIFDIIMPWVQEEKEDELKGFYLSTQSSTAVSNARDLPEVTTKGAIKQQKLSFGAQRDNSPGGRNRQRSRQKPMTPAPKTTGL